MAQKFSSFYQLFSSFETRQTPALIWYSVPGERIELSGRVLMNWVSKTSNLLDDELDFADNPQASILFGPHWRSAVLACAVLNCGGTLSFESEADSSVVVTDSASEAASWVNVGEHEYVVAVDRGPLSARFMGDLTPDAIDYCAEVRSFGDAYFPFSPATADTPAWDGAPHAQALQQVLERAASLALAESPAILLPMAQSWTTDFITDLLAILASGKTAVLLDPTITWSQERQDRIAHDEKASSLPA